MNRLGQIQKQLHAPKSNYNEFGRYKFRSCEDILEAVKKVLDENESVTISDEIVLVGDRYYIKATVTLRLADTVETATAYAREPLNKKGADESQVTGATSSYARKYALNGLFAIDDTKDADSTNDHGQGEKKQSTQPAPPSEKQIKFIKDLNAKHKVMSDEQIAAIKTSGDAKAIIEKLMAKGR